MLERRLSPTGVFYLRIFRERAAAQQAALGKHDDARVSAQLPMGGRLYTSGVAGAFFGGLRCEMHVKRRTAHRPPAQANHGHIATRVLVCEVCVGGRTHMCQRAAGCGHRLCTRCVVFWLL